MCVSISNHGLITHRCFSFLENADKSVASLGRFSRYPAQVITRLFLLIVIPLAIVADIPNTLLAVCFSIYSLDKKELVKNIGRAWLLLPLTPLIMLFYLIRGEIGNNALLKTKNVSNSSRVDFLGGSSRVDFIGGCIEGRADVVSLEILSYLSFTAVARVCRVSKRWRDLADNPDLLKRSAYRDVAFGSPQWKRCFSDGGLTPEAWIQYELDGKEFASLPSDIGKILKAPCHAFPGERVIKTHLLLFFPKGFALHDLSELVKKQLGKDNPIFNIMLQKHSASVVEQSTWLLVTKTLLPGSGGMSFDGQKNKVAELAENSSRAYEIPSTLVALASTFVKHLLHNNFKSELCYTRTTDIILFAGENVSAVAQSLAQSLTTISPIIHNSGGADTERVGIVAVWRLFPAKVLEVTVIE